jgi:hypothetical protein
LALLRIADAFIGTSSGFATFATFTDIAYAIVNVEQSFAGPAEVRPGDRHFPFAKANQILTWQQESTEELLALFEEVYSRAVTEPEFKPRTGMIVGEDGRSQRSSGRP